MIDLSGYAPRHVEPLLSRWGGRIGHYLFCSTSSVYRIPPPVPHDESAELTREPGTYGGDKALAEDAALAGGRPATSLRPQAVFGPHDCAQAAYALSRMAGGTPVLLRPGTENRRLSFLWVGDLVEAFIKLIGRPEAFGRVFDAAGPDPVDPEGFGRILARVSGLRFLSRPLSPALGARLPHLGLPWLGHELVSEASALARLGVPRTPLTESIARTWRWLQEDPRRLRPVRQRWEGPAAQGRLPPAPLEWAWRVADALRRR